MKLYGHSSSEIKSMSINSYAETKMFYLRVKRILDIICGCVGFVICFPFLLIITVTIRIIDGSDIFYKQARIGRFGKEFFIYKFRTMKKNCDSLELLLTQSEYEYYKDNYKLKNDQRITKLGRFLRKSSLDELPQLINIVKGEMSFVGPRPVLQEETERYGEKRDLLLSIRPGLTGYWQVNGRSNTTYQERMKMELYYCEHFYFMLDVKIILKTFLHVLIGKGAR